jgi:transcriptional regulator with XRE-family HTH domain
MNDEQLRCKIGQRLKLAREQAGLSQGQTAKLMDMHRPSVSEIEAGRRRVSADELSKFAGIYGVDANWLTYQEPESEDSMPDKLKLAARKLSHLNEEELDSLLDLLSALRNSTNNNDRPEKTDSF